MTKRKRQIDQMTAKQPSELNRYSLMSAVRLNSNGNPTSNHKLVLQPNLQEFVAKNGVKLRNKFNSSIKKLEKINEEFANTKLNYNSYKRHKLENHPNFDYLEKALGRLHNRRVKAHNKMQEISKEIHELNQWYNKNTNKYRTLFNKAGLTLKK
tara:strand:- start:475 stop:936 length:462 start_codon:yes stop_codon:yes gene_type:complete